MTNKPKPDGWFRQIPKSNTSVYKRMRIPFGLFVNFAFLCIFIGAWFERYITAGILFGAGWYVFWLLTEADERWYQIMSEACASWLRRTIKNKGRFFKPFLDT